MFASFCVALLHLCAGRSDVKRAVELTREVMERAGSKRRELAARIWTRPNATKRPFVFFHQRKTGGTSVRRMLVDSAKEQNLTYRVQCYKGIPCNSYDIPLKSSYDVYGGHLYFPSVVKSVHQRQSHHEVTFETEGLGFDCLTIFREPVSRVQSCWNFRFASGGAFKAFSAYNASYIEEMLPLGMSAFDEGCNNEPLRILSESGRSEAKINTLTSNLSDRAIFNRDTGWAFDAFGTLARTLEHMESCVVGILERCEETKLVVAHFFPWFDEFDCSVHKNVNGHHRKSSVADLDLAVVEEVKRQNALEIFTYKAANAMLDAQLDLTVKS